MVMNRRFVSAASYCDYLDLNTPRGCICMNYVSHSNIQASVLSSNYAVTVYSVSVIGVIWSASP